jgi:MAD (mothers against decapentaplegic) interacting protein
VVSPIDGMSMEGVESIHIHHATDYAGEKRAIRWTECFFIKNEEQSNPRFEPVDQSRLAEALAQACCIALTKHLDALKEAGLTKIALRATLDAEQVWDFINNVTI